MSLVDGHYSSVSQVKSLVRHLLDGEDGFNDTTRPPLGDVENFINYANGVLNSALAKYGFTTPVTQATVVYALDAWVTSKAAAWVEATQRGAGFSDDENTRTNMLGSLMGDADDFVKTNVIGWQELGAAYSSNVSAGAAFTALDKNSQRSDPRNTTREQPLFKRRQFDRSGPV